MARNVQELSFTHQIELLPWPACSPDLSPIENVWFMLAQLGLDTPPAATPDQLRQNMEAAWTDVPQRVDYLKYLPSSTSGACSFTGSRLRRKENLEHFLCEDGDVILDSCLSLWQQVFTASRRQDIWLELLQDLCGQSTLLSDLKSRKQTKDDACDCVVASTIWAGKSVDQSLMGSGNNISLKGPSSKWLQTHGNTWGSITY
ncbi:hypothetical protein TNCV_3201881 [Trichonephila clavipes]|nr:hypothetical protein TNCV_3201881 [Trichonephila clavipes]